MAAAIAPGARPISSVDELVGAFAAGEKPRAAWRIGVEHEKIGVVAATGMPLVFDGAGGIEALLAHLAAGGSWHEVREGTRVVALARGAENVTLEPGGQLEHSAAPTATLAESEAALEQHLGELVAPSREAGAAWLGVGFRPFGTRDDVAWMPKGRYAIMRDYLPTRGRLAHEMMKRTATVQANLDFADEADAAAKLAAASGVSSIVTALYACSPIVDGKDSGYQSYRAGVWLETDPDRCGLLPLAFEEGDLYRRYAEWALDVPMLFLYRDGYRAAGGMTFRRFLREGFGDERATMADWTMHVSTLFPEVRLKQVIELRGADAGPMPMVLALPALWKGLLYDDDACREARRLTAGWSFAERLALRASVPRAGLAARAGGRSVLELARELVAIARAGLTRLAPDDVAALAPLEEIAQSGRAPAERVREVFRDARGPAEIVQALRLVGTD
ncbi:MAG: glutamate--cysteine ligase [Myxococcales bacterium]|nr:glutamate--cysteine ligase [Myxococcales bacterium]